MAYRDELEAALARAEAAERRLLACCAVHTTLPAFTSCARCTAGACEACAMPGPDGTLWCTRCYVARRDRLTRLRWAATVVIAGAVGAGAVATIPGRRLAPVLELARPAASLAVARRTSFGAELAREALARTPCVPERALELAAELRAIEDSPGIVALVEGFEERCGPTAALRWEEAQARAALGQWDAALVALEAVVAEPGAEAVNLPVILYLRGAVGERLRRLEQAAADFAAAVPVADSEWRLAELGEALGRPCEGAFAVKVWEPPSDPATRRRLDEQWLRGGCGRLAGHGDVVRLPRGAAVSAAIGDVTMAAVLDDLVPAVVLSAAAADAAGIVASGPVVEVVLFGKARRAQRAVASRVGVRGATAAEVPVVIVDDEVAPGVEVVVGAPWLWRFERGRVVIEDADGTR
jgi:hypothetical protein